MRGVAFRFRFFLCRFWGSGSRVYATGVALGKKPHEIARLAARMDCSDVVLQDCFYWVVTCATEV